MDNLTLAQRLREHARQLDGRDGNLFRIRAYRRAAQILMGLERPVTEILAEAGVKGLQDIQGIGTHLAFTIEHLARTGEFLTFDERPRTRIAS
jgi:DNA polymerase (family 10)